MMRKPTKKIQENLVRDDDLKNITSLRSRFMIFNLYFFIFDDWYLVISKLSTR
jgi:hypothetical protein